ncbi:MAG: hypothetical protein IBV53_01395 [Candidatus Atribacteria bacterium]
MKKLLVLTLVVGMSIFLFVSCLSLNNEPILSLSYVEWYTKTEEIGDLTFGYVHLSLSGSTTGDKVTVITYGDGVIAELELDLDQDKKFAQDVIIQFTHAADDIPRKYSTVLTASKGNYTTSINLESEELTYLK